MITDIRYPFGKYNVAEKDNNLFLEKKSQECSSEQYLLFSSMLNFGYIGFEPGVFSVTAKDIINFWKYACSTILKNYTIEKYYKLLNIEAPYKDRIPILKTEGSFSSKDFKIFVAWKKIGTNTYSQAIKYEQKGLKLKDNSGYVLGSLYPEYLELYYKVDNANSNWEKWGNKERYDFLEEIDEHSKKREVKLDTNLRELLSKHKNEG